MKLQLKLELRDCLIKCTLKYHHVSSMLNSTTFSFRCFSTNSKQIDVQVTDRRPWDREIPARQRCVVITRAIRCCFRLPTMTMTGDLNVNPTIYINLTSYCQFYRLLVQLNATKTRLYLSLPTVDGFYLNVIVNCISVKFYERHVKAITPVMLSTNYSS